MIKKLFILFFFITSVLFSQVVPIGVLDEIDINMIVTPGINYTDHSKIIDRTLQKAEERADVVVGVMLGGLPP